MASITNIGTNALLAFQRATNTIGHNIANANTPGYSRQRVIMATQQPQLTGAGYVGSGVHVVDIQRLYDDFIATQVRTSQSSASQMETLYEHASRLDDLLAHPDIGLNSAVQDFFNSLQEMADDPTSLAARQVVMSESNSLADRFNYLDSQFDTMRSEVNQELESNINLLNGYAESIANLNQNIIDSVGSSSGHVPNDLLDQREQLIKEVSKLVEVNVVPQDNGAYNLFVGKGQLLVIGGVSSTMSLTQNPADLRSPDIAITNSFGNQVITNQVTGGELGGLVQFRSDYIDSGQNKLGVTAAAVVTGINAQHELGLDLQGVPGGDYFQPLTIVGQENQNNTGTGAVDLTFSNADLGDLTTSDYELVYNGGGNYTLTRLSDNNTWVFPGAAPPTIDGFNLNITAGANAGDSFLIQPSRMAPGMVDFVLTDPNTLAAASPLRTAEVTDANGNPINTGNAVISQSSNGSTTGLPLAADVILTFSNSADGLGNPGFTLTNGPGAPNDYVLYDPATIDRNGKNFPDAGNPTQFVNFGDLSFEVSGVPQPGDQFVISNNTNGTSDNRNALLMAELQSQRNLYNGAASIQESYSRLVSDVGARTRHAEINYHSQQGLLESHEAALTSVNGVNLDEEAANLVKYQQAYQAAAQVIGVAGTLFDTLLGAVRGA